MFADLGADPREAAELQVKAELTRQLYNRIKSTGLTQMKASERLGISQPDVSKLMNTKFTGYSTDRLIAMLNAVEVDVDIVLRPRRENSRHSPGLLRVRQDVRVA